MNRGFYIILSAQFFSALADNALLFAAIALLKDLHSPAWHTPVLQQCFVISYILLAPFVGAFADAIPKGRVMLISNTIKVVGSLTMLVGLDPLFAYAIVGLGAAAYSPAKYGILTEYLPPEKLVMANGWMEGLTVTAIILGAVIGGMLVNQEVSSELLRLCDIPHFESGIDTAPELAIAFITGLYAIAALFNLRIPKMAIDHKPPRKNPIYIVRDFWHCFKLLWRDPLGQVSLAVTTLFWGAGATLRLLVLSWSAVALNFGMGRATLLTAWVAVGIAVGSIIAAKFVALEKSIKVLPVGIAMGFIVVSMIFVTNATVATILLIVIGAMGGFFVVPMNALLQHRGHLLMGAGHSIAVQNFNENLSILAMLGAYAMMIKLDLTVYTITIIFGLFLSSMMGFLYYTHRGIGVLPTESGSALNH